MEFYAGLADYNWYISQKQNNPSEVNFWRPGTTAFKAIKPNDMFLFKLKKPYYTIVGGGFLVGYSSLPMSLAWEAFGTDNGVSSREEFYRRIKKYKTNNNIQDGLSNVGCIILTEPFFFEEKDWIKPMNDWSSNIVTGKKYDIQIGEGKRVYEEVVSRLNKRRIKTGLSVSLGDTKNSYYESLTKHRIGQGAFRIIVTDAYNRRCAISGEKTLPVLEAAHIKAFSQDGPNNVSNGLLLRSDLHKLYDKGYITLNTDYVVEVSKSLHEDYGNGKMYYEYHGKKLTVMPDDESFYPNKEYLEWHNTEVYKN